VYQVGKKDYHEDNKDGNGLGLFQEPLRYRKHENYETLHVQFQVPRSNFKPSILQQNTGALPPYSALFFPYSMVTWLQVWGSGNHSRFSDSLHPARYGILTPVETKIFWGPSSPLYS